MEIENREMCPSKARSVRPYKGTLLKGQWQNRVPDRCCRRIFSRRAPTANPWGKEISFLRLFSQASQDS